MYDKEEADNLAFQKGTTIAKNHHNDPLVKSQPQSSAFSLN
jgi:hypothetical protein